MLWLQIVSTIILYTWLFTITYLLWNRAKKNDATMQKMLGMLADIALQGIEPVRKAADAAEQSAEAARLSASVAQRAYDAAFVLPDNTRGTP